MFARRIQVNGIVQGVGFRPFVARTARSLGLVGWVCNDPDGVSIWIEGPDEKDLERFSRALVDDAPAASRIISVAGERVPAAGHASFEIRRSETEGTRDTLVSPDLATCDECLSELFDPDDRRYHYPFINCTNCGPRFTIIEDLPYDRAVTSMKGFAMCEACADEYVSEDNRRYHAQPNACFECGPRLWWRDGASPEPQLDEEDALEIEPRHITRDESDELIAHAAQTIETGGIVAVKGLGGWHLVCDASDEKAVAALRKRKHRPTKPLAIMVRDLERARGLCAVNEREAELLSSPARPIVLLQRRPGTGLAENVMGKLPEVGVMLPSTPVQHLLVHATERPLVMTSGNRSGEPIVATDADALTLLAPIADAFLGNNRAIVARYDDSVCRILADGTTQLVRRARGYAPMPLFADDAPATCILATGPEQKSTLALAQGRRIYVSQHLGDLEHLGAFRAWDEARERYERLFGLEPRTIACDLHPEYLASKWAQEKAAETGIRLVGVQHHHAHIASVLGENGLTDHVIGVALDGTGYGTDGTIWGGELLIADRAGFERFWHLPTFKLPGGAAAIKHPARTAHALLRAADSSDDPFLAPFKSACWERDPLQDTGMRTLVDQMIDKNINSPACSSMGRLFDAVSALLGICTEPGYDGEAACLLEAAARAELDGRDMDITTWASREEGGLGADGPLTALTFHRHVIDAIIRHCEEAREATSLETVALSGGCMVNRLLFEGLRTGLSKRGFTVYANRELPPNDGCVSYGQAIVARARLWEE